MRFLKSGFGSFGVGVLALAGGCHLIVGIRDAEPYPPDAGAGGAGGAAACAPSQTQDCYGGPEQTEGLGVCKAGTQTCQADGEWGPCEGEVRPGTEDCSAPEDEDCNGYACGETLWVKQFGDQPTNAYSQDVAVDYLTGDIYFTGSFSGSLTIGTDTLVSQGNVDAFLAKFDREGSPLWAKLIGEGTAGTSIGVDGQGNVIVIGTAAIPVNLGGDELPGGVFVGKFTSSGQHIWSHTCQCNNNFGFRARGAVDPSSGDIVIAGGFARLATDTMTCGNIAVTGTSDVFVAKFAASDGSTVFSKAFNGAGEDTAQDVAVDEQGSIILTGFGYDLSFDGPPLTDGYVVKLASNGSHVWSRAFADAHPQAITFDAAGDLAITGEGEAGVLNFGGDDLPPNGTTDMFVARFDGGGDHVWSRRFGSSGNVARGLDIAFDSAGGLAMTGEIQGNVPIDDVILVGDFNQYVVKFDASGTAIWSKVFGGPKAYSLAFALLNELVVGGQSSMAADFGEGLVNPVGESDLFLLKIAP